MDFSWKEIEEKWQNKWEESKIFEPSIDETKPKFYITVAFPYLSGMPHVGHARTYTIPDVISRFKRMQGYNVLFPMAWHITGSPIIGISERIKERDEKTIRIYRDIYHVPEDVLYTFEDPKNIVNYFMKEAKRTFKRAGFSIDWSREFYTTSLHPQFNRFIEWQFVKLKEKGYIVKGSHRVRWDPVVGTVLGDHDLIEGEDAQILEYILIKFRLDDKILPAATLRPETVYGVTNMWVNPDAVYVEAEVNREKWIISKEAAEKLKHQEKDVKIVKEIKGEELVGKIVTNPVTGENVPILPAKFVDTEVATGIVMSVPSHAPFDHIALEDLKNSEFRDIVNEMKYVSLIEVEGYGEFPAVEECEKLGIKSQEDTELLEKATKNIYKVEYHKGVFKIEPFKGLPVKEVKEKVEEMLKEKGIGDIMYDFSDKNVISRFGNKAVVKIIHDQWFIDYGNEQWKEKTREALKEMKIIPESKREQFEAIIDWLDKKACVRKVGLGTPLPWDKSWVIESLSDSTIYMAYYTISKTINKYKIDAKKLTDELFDYIFTEEKNSEKERELSEKTGLEESIISEMKNEFDYWYPLDWRTSGKDLIPNHLTFFIYNHVAIFPKRYWPKGIAVNGFGILEGQKMSKSKGNVLNFIDAIEENGSDVTRMYIMSLAEHDNDFDWRRKEVGKLEGQLKRFFGIISKIAEYEKGDLKDLKNIDKWLLYKLNKAIRETTEALENFKTKTAVQSAFYSLMNAYKWYERRTKGRDDEKKRSVLRYFAENWVKLMAPFVPHTAEELWEKLGGKNFVSIEKWPEVDEKFDDPKLELEEEYLEKIIEDLQEIKKITKKEKFEKIYIYTAEPWKWKLWEIVKNSENPKEAMKRAFEIEEIKAHGKDVPKLVEKFVKEKDVERIDEEKVLMEALNFISEEVSGKVFINPEDDPGNKRKQALPMKPAIWVE